MKEYHKIQTMFKREQAKPNRILVGQWSLPEFEYLQGNEWQFTEKVDGTNIRVMWDGKTVRYGGKTDAASIPTFLFNRLQDLFGGERGEVLLPVVFPPREGEETAVCLYGEGFGAKIQKAGSNYISDGVDFVLFDVNVSGWWLQRSDVEAIADSLGLLRVPEVGRGTLSDGIALVQKGFTSEWGNFMAEGIVAKPAVELRTRRGERLITKIKHVDFALL